MQGSVGAAGFCVGGGQKYCPFSAKCHIILGAMPRKNIPLRVQQPYPARSERAKAQPLDALPDKADAQSLPSH
jgi:hypothetical protein